MSRILPALLFIFFGSFSVLAQIHTQSQNDSLQKAESLAYLHRLYDQELHENLSIHIGKEYFNTALDYTGIPFYKSDQFTNGSVFYQDELYENIPLLYDLVTDQIITTHLNELTYLQLIGDNVNYFKIHGHTFIKMADTISKQNTDYKGFYDLLYNVGKVQVLAKYVKKKQESGSGQILEKRLEEKISYYINRDNIMHRVSSTAGALKVFAGYQKQIKKQLKSQGIKYRKSPERALLLMAETFTKQVQQ